MRPSLETDCLVMRVETGFAALEPIREQWDQAVASLGGSIYMTFDWVRVWWEHYGEGKVLRVFIFQSNEEIVGIVPLYFESIGIWPLKMRIARFVGANIPPKVFDPPVHPDWAEAVFEKLVICLLEDDRCDLLSFGQVCDQHAAWRHFIHASDRWASLGCTDSESNSVHSVFYLPATMEEFLGPFGKSRTKYRGRYELRPIKKLHADATTDVVSERELLEDEFGRFVVQHAQQWRSEGQPGHFGDWPDGFAYNRALVKAHGALGRVRFTRILAGGRVIASEYIFAFGGCYYWELPSREMGQPWDDFRLGSAGALTMVGAAIKEGVKRVEAGLGHYPYKLELGAKEHATLVFRVTRRGMVSRLRRLVCDGLRLLLRYGYNKLWFRRIQPRLPERFHRPQWGVCLRFDY